MRLPTFRQTYFICFVLTCLLFGFIIYAQVSLGVKPCLLSFIARIVLFLLGAVFLAAALYPHSTFSKKPYNAAILIISILGMSITGRHSWIQRFSHLSMPHYYASGKMNLWDMIKRIYTGTPECASIYWKYLI